MPLSTSTPAPTRTGRRAAPTFGAWRDARTDELLATLPAHLDRAGWDRTRLVEHQRRAVHRLLHHARRHSPFHARRLGELDIDRVEPGDLSALPVMTKADLMTSFDDVVTDRRVTRALAEEALADTTDEPRPLPGGHLALTSGGSSGQRGVFVLDPPALNHYVASLTRGLVARIQALGGPPPGGLPIAILGAGCAAHPTGIAGPMTRGGALPFRYLPVPVTQPTDDIVDQLNAMRPPMLYGYPSVLARLADEQRAGRLRIAPVAVTSTSETLTEDLRASVRDGFHAPIVDSFASTEGLVGISAPDDDVITFAEDGCIIELVDADHRPVPPGTPSARVLITALHNLLQPLIRYELTDSLTAVPPTAGNGHLRARVQGRSDDTFHYPSATIHPFVIRGALARTPEITEYQVHQHPDGIDLSVVVDPAIDPTRLDTTALTHHVAAALSTAGLPQPVVDLHVVHALARHPLTGKLRRFVPLPSHHADQAAVAVADRSPGPPA